jgi:Mg2+ and Co2+ transporter CorA
MNFDVIPGLHHPYSFWVLLAGMGALAAGMLGYFRYKDWI